MSGHHKFKQLLENLPPDRKAKIDQKTAQLLMQEYQKQEEAKLETLLLEGLNSGEVTPMTPKDWVDIRQAVRQQVIKDNNFSQE
ncbi:hypothetical protein [Planktothrix pseudagardhii]|uniref:Uncharacterized protein n=1 Tax=Planktothrix pseudagardhii TaxID=132604 RepID=A0A9W4CNL4_9CYAN|nr:hypothetical protein [Planktothrix pseudagardhii]CAD5939985.1 hypothetical protein NO713_01855 [Planktothrix pseudagardhii]